MRPHSDSNAHLVFIKECSAYTDAAGMVSWVPAFNYDKSYAESILNQNGINTEPF